MRLSLAAKPGEAKRGRHNVTTNPEIVSRRAQVDGGELHYLTAGQRSLVILLHGYT
jgi:hypothetical protein